MSSFLDHPPVPAPDGVPDGAADAPEPHAMGAARGEEFDLSRLDEGGADEQPKGSPKWNAAWLAVAGALALYCGYFYVYGLGVHAQKPLPLGPVVAGNANAALVRVHVAGGVAHPGVVSLRADARVGDAVQKAGGALPNADPDALNLAAFVEDGAKITVPLKPAPTPKVTPTPVVIVREVPVPVPTSAPASPPSVPASPPSLAPSPPSVFGSPAKAAKTPTHAKKKSDNIPFLRAHPVDLNRATIEQLQQLPGVGPKMAERILAYRAENTRFKSVADLDNVKGIGEKKMAVLKDLVTVK